jgi:histidinol dehydrogenase
VQWLNSQDADFTEKFQTLVNARRETDDDVSDSVRAILKDVQARGDAAVADYTKTYDHIDITQGKIEITAAEIDDAISQCTPELLTALELAATRIRVFHELQRPEDKHMVDNTGTITGYRWNAIDRAGIYVPGGRASYPSSVLMNAIPASVAGVKEIIMVTPTPRGVLNPLVLAAARLAGVSRIFRIGGAQAIAALAYGTSTIPAVDKITGPGNAFVAEAKRQVFGVVGIDMIAGPSEIVVVADGLNNPKWIAADLLSQAEHDPLAQSILITDTIDFADAVVREIEAIIPTLSTAPQARASWDALGAIILVPALESASALVDALAPEHIELAVADPAPLFAAIRHAGSIFIGRHTPEAVGDYVAGPNHVLPTGRRARFSSGLGVTDFMKRSTYLECSAESLKAIGPAAERLAISEGLPAHALSISVRNKLNAR